MAKALSVDRVVKVTINLQPLAAAAGTSASCSSSARPT